MKTRGSPSPAAVQKSAGPVPTWFVNADGHLLFKAGEKKSEDKGKITGCSFLMRHTDVANVPRMGFDRFLVCADGKNYELSDNHLVECQQWNNASKKHDEFYAAALSLPKDKRNAKVEGTNFSSYDNYFPKCATQITTDSHHRTIPTIP